MDVLKVPKRFNVQSRTMRFMLYTLFGLIVADGLITQFLVTNGHARVEDNPNSLVMWYVLCVIAGIAGV